MSGSVPSSLSPTDQMHKIHMILHSLTGEREEEMKEEGREGEVAGGRKGAIQ